MYWGWKNRGLLTVHAGLSGCVRGCVHALHTAVDVCGCGDARTAALTMWG